MFIYKNNKNNVFKRNLILLFYLLKIKRKIKFNIFYKIKFKIKIKIKNKIFKIL